MVTLSLTHSGLDWNLLNLPSRCLPLSCWSDGQEYWVVLFETGLWQRDVGSFWHQFLRVVLKAGGSCFPCQAFEAGMHELLCRFFTATIPSAFSPLCPQVSHPCPTLLIVSLIQPVSALPTYSCHLIPIPAGSHVQSHHLKYTGWHQQQVMDRPRRWLWALSLQDHHWAKVLSIAQETNI